MYLKYIIFVTLLTAASCQYVDQVLKTTLLIEVDKTCMQLKIGKSKYDALTYPLSKCSVDIFQKIAALPIGSVDSELASVCRQQKSELSCLTEIAETLDPCLNNYQKNHLKYKRDGKQAYLAYICNNQALLKETLRADKSKCAKPQYQDKYITCLQMPEIQGLTVVTLYQKEGCQSRLKLTKCLADYLRSCAGEAVYKFSMETGYAEFNATPCKEHVSGGTESGSGGGGTQSGSGGGGTQNKVNGCNAMAWLSNVLITVISICCWLPNVFF